MFRTLILGLSIVLCSVSSAYANPQAIAAAFAEQPQSNIVNDEAKDAIHALQHDFDKEDAPYIRFLSTYGIQEDSRESAVLTASFVLHSLVGVSQDDEEANGGAYYPLAKLEPDAADPTKFVFTPYQQVKNSKTLWWIDLRNYNFKEQSWENISVLDPYFTEPIVHTEENGLLRILAGNAIVRMDWFIFHATDVTSEVDAGRNVKIYNELLYSFVEEPKTVDQFRKIWGLHDIEKSRQLGNEYSALVTKSKQVARHNRLLFGYRTELGWLYQSYDVLSHEGLRDYVESAYRFNGKPPPSDAYDAGEMFATNQVKMQVYALNNNKEELIDFADPRVARHLSDVTGNAAVRIAHSCIDCHAAGPIPSENTLNEFMKSRLKLYTPKKGDSLRIERSFLSGKFEDAISDDQISFARSLEKVNGLKPDQNAKNYLKSIEVYDKPLTLKDVAYECGVTEDAIIKAAEQGLQDFNRKVPGRLDLLIKNGESIPRDLWDSPGRDGIPGLFQQTMIMLYGLTELRTEIKEDIVIDKPVIDEAPPVELAINKYMVLRPTQIYIGANVVGTLRQGEIIEPLDSQMHNGEKWLKIRNGWVTEKNLQPR